MNDAEPDLDRALAVATDAALGAGRIELERYERLERIVHKSERDVVTEADHLAEEFIISTIRSAFPDDAFLAEESGKTDGRRRNDGAAPVPEADRLWVIDPLDGTINYANGIPVFCVSVALVVDGRPRVGVIHDPSRTEVFTACAGRGAWLDGVPIRHPGKERLIDAVVSMSLRRGYARRASRIRRKVRVTRDLGSASLSLAYVSNGRFDAFIQAGGLSAWDIAAAGLIAQEAGATVTTPDGGPWFDLSRGSQRMAILAASPAHHATLVELLRQPESTAPEAGPDGRSVT
jgi:myo-inositol-1(or 4)-monophosphatase